MLFVGGGIGVTPLHAAFRGLLGLRLAGALPDCCSSVRLVWTVRHPHMLTLFRDTWEAVGSAPGFSFGAWADDGGEKGDGGVSFRPGRPDLRAEVAALAARPGPNGRKLVFVCHVPAVAAQVSEWAQEEGLAFHSETFEL